MSASHLRRCACGALIVLAVAGGMVHHDPHTHAETFRADLAVVSTGVAASTSSAIATGYALRAEPGSYVLTFPNARLSKST